MTTTPPPAILITDERAAAQLVVATFDAGRRAAAAYQAADGLEAQLAACERAARVHTVAERRLRAAAGRSGERWAAYLHERANGHARTALGWRGAARRLETDAPDPLRTD